MVTRTKRSLAQDAKQEGTKGTSVGTETLLQTSLIENIVQDKLKKEVETRVGAYNRRTTDKIFELIKPIVPALIIGLIVSGFKLWSDVTLMQQTLVNLDAKVSVLTERLARAEADMRSMHNALLEHALRTQASDLERKPGK